MTESILVCRLGMLDEMDFITIENTGIALNDTIGGYWETFALPLPLYDRSLLGIADEDGIMRNLPYNFHSILLGRYLVGPLLIVRSQLPEFISLSNEDVSILKDWFGRITAI